MYDSEEDDFGKSPVQMFQETNMQQNVGQYEFRDPVQASRPMYGGINLRKSSDQMFGDTNLQRCPTQLYEFTNSVQDDRQIYERVTAHNSSKQMFGDTSLIHCPTEMYELANLIPETKQTYEYKNVEQDSIETYKDTYMEHNSTFGETRSECFNWDNISYEEGKLGLQIANSTKELHSQFTDFAQGFDKLNDVHHLYQGIDSISLFNSDYWLRQAGVLDDDFITCEDTSMLFRDKFGDNEIDFAQWLEYVEELCLWKQLDLKTVKMLLISCGHLGEKPVIMPKSLPEYYRPYIELCANVNIDGQQDSYYWCRDVQTSTDQENMKYKACQIMLNTEIH